MSLMVECDYMPCKATQNADGKALVVRMEPRPWYRHVGVDQWPDLPLTYVV